ncbi:MAG: carboxypeptidase-like regulatory domain-containing protein, partial [Bacteroidota bacterium]
MKPRFTFTEKHIRRTTYIFTFLFCCCSFFTLAQSATLIGTVSDEDNGTAIDFATVYVKGSNNAVETNESGQYRLEVKPSKRLTIVFTRTGYEQKSITLKDLKASETRTINMQLKEVVSDIDITVRDKRMETTGMVTE